MKNTAVNNLHQAVLRGDEDKVRYFIDQGVNVNEKQSGIPPILLAACIKDEQISNNILKILIDNGADINVSYPGFNTPLYQAIFYKRRHLVELLLNAGAVIQDELHIAAEKGSKEILSMLLKRCTKEQINSGKDGVTPMHIAAQNMHEDCLTLLILHSGDLSCSNDDGQTVMELIFEHFSKPVSYITSILDASISSLEVVRPNFKLKGRQVSFRGKQGYRLDFSILAPSVTERQMDVTGGLLEAANDEEKAELLQHPLIEVYLIKKWRNLNIFFYLILLLYFNYVMSLSLYAEILLSKNVVIQKFLLPTKLVVMTAASGFLVHVLWQCILRPKKWLSLEVWRNVIALTLSITVTALGNHPVMAYWILHTLSIVVLLAWTELMLLIGKLPSLGYYALMFTTVLNNVLKVFGAFICLIIGYALCFSIQFYNFEEFRNPLRALVKTMVMMMGEFEYGDLFSDETIAPARIDLTSRLVFLIFVIVTSIVLMNLLVGLAVSDVQELQKVSHAKKMEKQAEFLIHMEKGIAKYLQLPCKFLPFKQYIIRRNAISTLFEFVDNAKFRRSKILSSRLIDNIKVVAKKQKGKWKPEITSESTLSINIET